MGIVGVWIRTVQRAHDTAGDGEAESEGIAEGKHRLSRTKRRRIAYRNIGQIRALDLDDRQIGERVGTYQLRCKNTTVAERDFDVGSAIHHVIVGHDITIRRDDDAAADAVFDPRLGLARVGRTADRRNAASRWACLLPLAVISHSR